MGGSRRNIAQFVRVAPATAPATLVGLVALVVVLGATASVVSAGSHPLLLELRESEPKTPVVFIPGLTGSKLRDKATGKTIWGRAGNFMGPRDGGRKLALSIAAPPELGERVEPFEIIERMRIYGFLPVKIYGPLITTLVRHGYHRGNLLDPRPDDTLLVFPYDWRYGNIEAAQQLALRLERLRQVRGESPLRVVLICHSNAARIARWYVKYGGASLQSAEAGQARPTDNVVVDKIIFVGTGQGGALPTFTVMDRGRTYVPLGKRFRPEYMFAMAGLYEALPAHRDDLFFDEAGATLPVDLFDAAAWPEFGWSAYGEAAQRRIARLDADDAVLGTAADRRRWLEDRLDIAQRVQTLLLADIADYPPVRLYQVQAAEQPTAARALIAPRRNGRVGTFTVGDRRVRRNKALAQLGTAPGDRHATRRSMDWLSPQEQAAVVGATYSVDAVHRLLFSDPTARLRILEYLLDDAPR